MELPSSLYPSRDPPPSFLRLSLEQPSSLNSSLELLCSLHLSQEPPSSLHPGLEPPSSLHPSLQGGKKLPGHRHVPGVRPCLPLRGSMIEEVWRYLEVFKYTARVCGINRTVKEKSGIEGNIFISRPKPPTHSNGACTNGMWTDKTECAEESEGWDAATHAKFYC